jgi:hypothetical protein
LSILDLGCKGCRCFRCNSLHVVAEDLHHSLR